MGKKIDLKKIPEQIKKTGFILEYDVSKILEKKNWRVINNRYYLDDVQGIEREIDVLAYKSRSLKNTDIRFYTVLLISCKKSFKNAWSFFTKKFPAQNHDFDFLPLKFFTNVGAFKLMVDTEFWKKQIKKAGQKNQFLNNIFGVRGHAFAFQELKKKDLSPADDKRIFSSISSLIKAQSYESAWLKNDNQSPRYYDFHLITVLDTNLIEVQLFPKKQIAREIDHINYINRHIINQKDDFFRVNFITFDAFKKRIQDFNNLHKWNLKNYSNLLNYFYKDIFSYKPRINVYIKNFSADLLEIINAHVSLKDQKVEEIKNLDLKLKRKNKRLEISLELKPLVLNFLNSNKNFKADLKAILIRYYQYRGLALLKEKA